MTQTDQEIAGSAQFFRNLLGIPPVAWDLVTAKKLGRNLRDAIRWARESVERNSQRDGSFRKGGAILVVRRVDNSDVEVLFTA